MFPNNDDDALSRDPPEGADYSERFDDCSFFRPEIGRRCVNPHVRKSSRCMESFALSGLSSARGESVGTGRACALLARVDGEERNRGFFRILGREVEGPRRVPRLPTRTTENMRRIENVRLYNYEAKNSPMTLLARTSS